MAPSQERWKGFGLIYIKQPTREDGSDGAAYLAEMGAGEPGFDGDYTQFQLTIASRLYGCDLAVGLQAAALAGGEAAAR